jgi:hypothetical protein
MPQQVGIISAQTLNRTEAMSHQRPSLAQRLDHHNSVVSPVCCAVAAASAGLLAACMGILQIAHGKEPHQKLFGASVLLVGVSGMVGSGFYAMIASNNLNFMRMNREAEVQASVELPAVTAAENRV